MRCLYKDAPASKTLPRVFIPSRKLRFRPPIMHYGWDTNNDRLLALAEERGLTQWQSLMDYSGGDPDDYSLPPVTLPPSINVPGTIDALVLDAAKRCTSRPPRTLKVICVANSPSCVAISNYDLVKPVSDVFVEKLRVALGEETPRWYLDDTLLVWTETGPVRGLTQ